LSGVGPEDPSYPLRFKYLIASSLTPIYISLTPCCSDLAFYTAGPFAKAGEMSPFGIAIVSDLTNDAKEVKLTAKISKENLKVGAQYQLRERLMDFNTSKVIKSLEDADELALAQPKILHHHLRSVRSFEETSASEIRFEEELNKLYRNWYKLNGDPKKPLNFLRSQRKVMTSLLRSSLTAVWGPRTLSHSDRLSIRSLILKDFLLAGSGKTHTLSLSTLRFLEVKAHSTKDMVPAPKVVIACTAFTRTAISKLLEGLQYCFNAWRKSYNDLSYDNVGSDLLTQGINIYDMNFEVADGGTEKKNHDDVRLTVLRGLDSAPEVTEIPKKSVTLSQFGKYNIVAGTVWKLNSLTELRGSLVSLLPPSCYHVM